MPKVIKQSYRIMGPCPTDHVGALKRIEEIGRVCWQSGEKTTEESYLKFVDMLFDKKHLAMLDHSLFVMASRCQQAALDDSNFIYSSREGTGPWIYAGNYRAYIEALGFTSIHDINRLRCAQVVENIPNWAQSVSVDFTTNRAMSHELVRHRPCGFAQLSQRYVDHTKDLEFILPVRYYDKQKMNPQYDHWLASMAACEQAYREARQYGQSPQEARDHLPNSTATQIIITAPLPQWQHMFGQRCAKGADPLMRDLMTPLRDEFISLGWDKI